MSSCFLSLALALCRSFSRWASLACRLLSLFLCLSLSLYSKFVDMTINLSLILQTTRIHKQFPLSIFVFIDSLVVSASQDAASFAISRQNYLELHLGCHTCWLRYFTLLCPWCGRTVGRAYGHVINKISRMSRLPHFLRYGAKLARFVSIEVVLLIMGCVALGWFGSGSVIRDHSDHCRSNEPMNPCPEWIHRFIWSTMIRVIADRGSLTLIQIT